MNTGSYRKRNSDSAVNGLRGLMLLIIVFTHYVPTAFFSGNIARPAAAVMLAVTGYFFMMVVERESIGSQPRLVDRVRSACRIFLGRHMRIWPVMAGVVLMYVGLGFLDPSPMTTQIHHTWPMYLTYLGNGVKMIYERDAFPAHFWLIGAQEQFALLALAAAVLFDARRMAILLKSAVVIGVAARIVGCMLWMPDHPALATENPFAIADAMALGMLCRLAIGGGRSKTRLRREIVLAGLATATLWATVPNTYAAYFGLVPFFTALAGCYFILLLSDDVRSRRLQRGIFATPILVALGQMSLSLFLLHPLVNTLINLGYARWTGALMPWWILFVIGPPLSVAVAYAYFKAVEVPIRRFRSRPAAQTVASRQSPPPPYEIPEETIALKRRLAGHPLRRGLRDAMAVGLPFTGQS